MKLTQIKLAGFKSFASPTTLDIQGKLVGIVGPNGCGKSNVIDAVRWVLGESSAKQLRGESMQDVIFNGSLKRKPVSRASVELVFDNSHNILSGLWNNYNEIAIKRLLSRSGESVYYINNQVVRRRDITELFLGTGVGTKGYAVIEQGMISRIIEAKPEELRIYLEEAAGVSKYREKRKETVNRLQDTKANLVRLEDIQSELIKQIESLTEQAQIAKYYQSLHEDLKHKQLLQVLIKMTKADGALAEINTNIERLELELAETVNKIEIIEDELRNKSEVKIERESELLQLTNQFNNLRTNLARLEERKRHDLELKERLIKERHALNEQLGGIDTHISELKEMVLESQEQVSANLLLIEEKQFIKEEQSTQFATIEDDYHTALDVVGNFNAELNQSKHQLDLLNNTLLHKKNQFNNLTGRLKKLEHATGSNILDFNQNYFALKDEVAEIAIELESLVVKKTNLTEQINAQDNIKSDNLNQIHQAKNSLASINAKIHTLGDLIKRSSLANDDIDILVNKLDLAPLWESLTVAPGYELAVGVALQNIVNAIAVDDLLQIKRVPEQKIALWLNNNTEVVAKDNTLAKFVKIQDSKLNALNSILNQYQVFASFAEVINNWDKSSKAVTLDGHLIELEYIVFNANNGQSHILEHKNQLETLSQERLLIEERLLVLEQTHQDTLGSLHNLNAELTIIEDNYKLKFKLQHDLALEFTKQEQIYVQTKAHQERVSQEITLLNQEIEYISDELSEIELKVEEAQLKIDKLNESKGGAELHKVERETAFNLAKNSLSDIDNQINQLIIDNQLLKQKEQNLSGLVEDKLHQVEQIKQRLFGVTDEEQNRSRVNNNEEELQLLQEQIGELALLLEEQNNKIGEINALISQIKNNLTATITQKEQQYDKLNQLRLKQQEQNLFLHNHQETLVGLELSEDADVSEILSNNKLNLNELQNGIHQIQEQISALGLVNLKAIEELELATNKNNDLLAQVRDLFEAIETLENAITQIDGETRKLLEATYTKVGESFNVYFKTLFGGGSAKLELTEKDILRAGLNIFAEPPGKKNSSIHLLSGGEKALTAMSLVFAFFNLNPAPFCLLDEVDAPLDDANTARFCNLVKELADKTQFVYISHNRLTMEIADQLVGVTMQEKGVSTTVSVTLVDAIKHVVAYS